MSIKIVRDFDGMPTRAEIEEHGRTYVVTYDKDRGFTLPKRLPETVIQKLLLLYPIQPKEPIETAESGETCHRYAVATNTAGTVLFTVPARKTLVILSWYCNTSDEHSAAGTLIESAFYVYHGMTQFIDRAELCHHYFYNTAQNAMCNNGFSIEKSFPQGSIVGYSANAASRIHCGFTGILKDVKN